MIRTSTILVLLLTSALLFSCRKSDDTITSSGSITFNFINKAGNDTIKPDRFSYTNSSGNIYSVSLLKYYVTNFTFYKSDGNYINLKNYDLIDAFEPSSWKINLSALPNGTYDSLSFFVGIDSTKNFDLVQTGDLDPSYNMFWSWSTGYIFFKHEGQYIGTANDTLPLRLHYGGIKSIAIVGLPMHFEVKGNHHDADVTFDLNALYYNPDIDFNIDNNHQSTFSSERAWLENMRNNFTHSFSITDIR